MNSKNLYVAFFLFVIIFVYSCTKDSAIPSHNNSGSGTGNNPTSSYLDKWTGDYEGTSRHWNSVWSNYSEAYKKVNVDVKKSNMDSCLNFIITYDDSIVETKMDLKFSSIGVYDSSWGGGSGFGYLSIDFISDSMQYNYMQKCGIPCSMGKDFKIKKK